MPTDLRAAEPDAPALEPVEIRNRWTGAVQFTAHVTPGLPWHLKIGAAVRWAVSRRDADLRGANLGDANLRGADLRDADLRGANLRGADLRDADLRGADLRDADLRGANLRGADLRDADLRGADLRDADLRGADLGGANLRAIKADFLSEVLRLPNELEALRDALTAGQVDGSTYRGPCACLAGTLARAHGNLTYRGENINLGPVTFHAAPQSPRERWFSHIRPGDTPKTNQCAAIALDWTNEAIAMRDLIRTTAAQEAA